LLLYFKNLLYYTVIMKTNLTIVVADTAYYNLTKRAIEQTQKITGAEKVLLFSDQNFYPGCDYIEISPIDQVEYNKLILKDIAPHITTDHFMVIQYDGMPINSEHWADEYLQYDYIGAPWPWGSENRRVGNGGFSIRSRRLAELCLDESVVFNPPGYGDNNYMEDTHICHLYRSFFDQHGMKFAPVNLAKKFSAEIPGGRFPTYGFHGTLCLPYYLDDDHMEFYIDNLSERQWMSPVQTRIFFGLYLAEKYDLCEHMMERGIEVRPDLKQVLINQLPQENNYFPNLTVADIEDLLINY